MLYLRVDESTICMKGEAKRRRLPDGLDLPAPDRWAEPSDTSYVSARTDAKSTQIGACACLACRFRALEA
jgi:hypothetical protein